MKHASIDIYLVIDTFLLLIGIGSKIALVPFVEITAPLDAATKTLIVRKILITATVLALILVGLGEFLSRLLHFSTASLSIAGGIILFIIAITRVRGSAEPEGHHRTRPDAHRRVPARDPAPPQSRRDRRARDPLSRGRLSRRLAMVPGVLAVVLALDVAQRRSILAADVLNEYSAEVIPTVSACTATKLQIGQVAELRPAFATFTESNKLAAQAIARQRGIARSALNLGRALGRRSRASLMSLGP